MRGTLAVIKTVCISVARFAHTSRRPLVDYRCVGLTDMTIKRLAAAAQRLRIDFVTAAVNTAQSEEFI